MTGGWSGSDNRESFQAKMVTGVEKQVVGKWVELVAYAGLSEYTTVYAGSEGPDFKEVVAPRKDTSQACLWSVCTGFFRLVRSPTGTGPRATCTKLSLPMPPR